MNVTNALSTGVIGLNRTFDNVAKVSSDIVGSGKADNLEEASGVQNGPAVEDTTVNSNDPSNAVSVVTQTEEVQSGMIDVHV